MILHDADIQVTWSFLFKVKKENSSWSHDDDLEYSVLLYYFLYLKLLCFQLHVMKEWMLAFLLKGIIFQRNSPRKLKDFVEKGKKSTSRGMPRGRTPTKAKMESDLQFNRSAK